jgi:hypothetical protein
MLCRAIIAVSTWTSKVVVQKGFYVYVMHFANITETFSLRFQTRGTEKGDKLQNVKICKQVTQRSAAVWRLPPSVRHRQYYFALSANSLRTANRWQCAPHHREMFWCQVVTSSLSSPIVACENCPVCGSSHPHPQQPFSITLKSRC